ncbi:putative MPP superfamily phosphohydrolase [Parabacteroides sp. PFB2-12]|uniref:metallophosphoesterase n=1 Tax=unclassified Parabacteroides TaxID=2649774 RepID=UPI0024770DE4|nr:MULTISPECIES: metallophosphoesterase [unclassified Parabacteroides]MDH6342446.1 putative MPP superfamily phosphohydrolase [Parabacteroides sp. PM6-13]MDH6390098.1 putative MPP superfamily phosphohydrolase [Parabacteroides sp. PFB2-12]
MRIFPILMMLSVVCGGYAYVYYRIWQMMPPSLVGRIILILVGLFLFLCPFISMGVGGAFPVSLSAFMYKVGTSWLIALLYLFMLFLVLDILRVTHILPVDRILYNSWAGLGGVACVMAVILSIGYYRYTHKTRVELTLPVKKELLAGNSLKIVAVSDLHLGYGIGKNEFEGWTELINRENPDIVLIAGDITDNNVTPLYKENMGEVFSRIKSNYGIYAIPGNHEYIAGKEKAMSFLQKAGVTVLDDSVALVADRFYVVGRDDRSNGSRKPLRELVASLDNTKPILLLDHQPYHLEEAEESGIDLQISGHTHGGQVWPATLVTQAIFEKDHGYLQKGNTHYYISSGLGIWGGKFRLGSQSEYVVITLVGEE